MKRILIHQALITAMALSAAAGAQAAKPKAASPKSASCDVRIMSTRFLNPFDQGSQTSARLESHQVLSTFDANIPVKLTIELEIDNPCSPGVFEADVQSFLKIGSAEFKEGSKTDHSDQEKLARWQSSPVSTLNQVFNLDSGVTIVRLKDIPVLSHYESFIDQKANAGKNIWAFRVALSLRQNKKQIASLKRDFESDLHE